MSNLEDHNLPLACEVFGSGVLIMGSLISGRLLSSSTEKETVFVSIENSMEFSLRYMLICPDLPSPGPRVLPSLTRALL